MEKPQSNSVKLSLPCCFTVSEETDRPAIPGDGGDGGEKRIPTHLVVAVHGLAGRADNWAYAAKQFIKRYPEDVVVLCSACNGTIKTICGVDIMGKRLAKEVREFVDCRPQLQKISIVAHSLGGLVARYAIALLYSNGRNNKEAAVNEGKIAGLEPVNFITFATPHLGSRSHGQIPIRALEKMAYRFSWMAGRSGNHLFLKDRKKRNPPLLLQMVTDFRNLPKLPFMSALRSFKRHVTYSNYCYDFIVGRETSSIRRRDKLPKDSDLVDKDNIKYPHIVYEDKSNATEDDFSDDMIYQARTTDDMKEVMIKSLNRIPWERIDVRFENTIQKICAHCTIQVLDQWLNSAGSDVINHMIDNFVL